MCCLVSQIKVFARAASQEGSEAYAAVVRGLLEKEADRSLTRQEAKQLARLREGWSRSGARSGAEYERLLEREREGKLTPAEKIKLDKWRDGKQLGGANAATEYERLLERERMGELTPAEKIKLDKWRDGKQLRGGDSWVRGDSWDCSYEELCAYERKNGDCLVPIKTQLGQWVQNQRTQYRLKQEGENSTLSDRRQRRLEEIGFVFRINWQWNERYQQLKGVGSCSARAIQRFDIVLYRWCRTQSQTKEDWEERKRELRQAQKEWKENGRRGDRPAWGGRSQAAYEKWVQREEKLGRLGFWNEWQTHLT